MKERLLRLLELEHLSPSKFADLIGVQRSSISHVLSGRNNPSFDFLQKTLKAFPGLKADWLMLGEGSMYAHMGRGSSDLFGEDPFISTQPLDGEPDPDLITEATPPVVRELDSEEEKISNVDIEMSSSTGKKVVQVMIFYDDDTFSSYKPSQ